MTEQNDHRNGNGTRFAIRVCETCPLRRVRGQQERKLVRELAVEQAGLTGRQIDVLLLMASGLPNKVIARQVDVTEQTVKFHIAVILRKLRTHVDPAITSRTAATAWAWRCGVMDEHERADECESAT